MTRAAETPGHPEARGVCPECATPIDSNPPGRGLRSAWVGRALPWLAVLIVVGVIVGGAGRNRMPIGGPAGPYLSWSACPARVTTRDLDRIASGDDEGAALAAWMKEFILSHGWATRTGNLKVRLAPPAGTRMETAEFGWPTAAVWRLRQTQYEDVYACSGPVARDWGIYGGSFWTTSWAQAGGAGLTVTDDRSGTNVPRLSLWVCCWLLLGWWLPSWIGALWTRVGRRERRRARPRTRLAIAGGAGVVLLALSLLAPQRQVGIELHTPTTTWGGPQRGTAAGPPIDSNLAADEVADMLEEERGVRELAAHLLTVLPTDQPEDIVQFGVTVASVSSQNLTLRGWPDQWLETIEEIRPSTPVRWATGMRLELSEARSGWLGVALANTQERRVAFVCLAQLAPMVLGAWVLWHLLRGVVFLFERRRVRRRRAGGLCLGCGYDLSGLRTGGAA